MTSLRVLRLARFSLARIPILDRRIAALSSVALSIYPTLPSARSFAGVAAAPRPASSSSHATQPPPTPTSCARSRPPEPPAKKVTPVQMLDNIRARSSVAPSHPLVDSFGRFHNYLRISLTERCNLRCVYCMPEEGVDLTPSASLLTSAEIQHLLELFVDRGVTKVRFTGGEPTVRKDLLDLIAHAGSLREKGLEQICLTTNGLVLARKLPALIQAGLTHVNISLDTLDENLFTIMTRRNGGKQVKQAILDAVAALTPPPATPSPSHRGLRSVKVNCVIMKGLNDHELLDFVALTKELDMEVRFIEYMPFDGNRWSDSKFFSYSDMLARIREKYPGLNKLGSEKNETAKSYQVPGHKGRIGFITSMSQNFCSTCNRLRITADGNLKVCLFGAEEVSLRDAIRSGMKDEDLSLIVGAAVAKKKAQHAGMIQLAQQKNRPMITIGG